MSVGLETKGVIDMTNVLSWRGKQGGPGMRDHISPADSRWKNPVTWALK